LETEITDRYLSMTTANCGVCEQMTNQFYTEALFEYRIYCGVSGVRPPFCLPSLMRMALFCSITSSNF
jgi:hypothetical protein